VLRAFGHLRSRLEEPTLDQFVCGDHIACPFVREDDAECHDAKFRLGKQLGANAKQSC
jgi:hypothetical protein